MKEDYQKLILEACYSDLTVIDEYSLNQGIFTGEYKKLFQAFKSIYNRGLQIEPTIILEAANKIGFDVSIFSGLERGRGNIEYNVRKHLENIRQEKIRVLALQLSDWQSEGKDSEEIIELTEKELISMVIDNSTDITDIKSVIMDVVAEIERRYKHKGELIGIPSGYPWLDKFTSGFRDGDLIILGARTSIGKTAIALCMISSMILSGIPVGLYTAEMDSQAIAERLISIIQNINLQAIRTGKVKAGDFANITEAAGILYESKFYIDDTPGVKLHRLKSKMRTMVKRGAKIIFIDYLTKINNKKPGIKRYEQVGEISETLKNMARELKIPVVALSQVGRGTEGKEPSLSDIRESGDIEQDADVIMFLHRKRGEKETILQIAKHRNGPLGKVDLLFSEKNASFLEDTIENRGGE